VGINRKALHCHLSECSNAAKIRNAEFIPPTTKLRKNEDIQAGTMQLKRGGSAGIHAASPCRWQEAQALTGHTLQFAS